MQQTVRLLDDLGARYGSEHVYFNLRSPAEAIKLLCINHPALQKELTEAHQHGVGYTLVQAGTFLGYDDLQLPLGKNDSVLAPVIAGSGGSTGQILAGVGLVVLSTVAAHLSAGFLSAGLGRCYSSTGAAAGGGFIAGTGGFLTAGILRWYYRRKFDSGRHSTTAFTSAHNPYSQQQNCTRAKHKRCRPTRCFTRHIRAAVIRFLLVLQIPLVLERQCLSFTASC